MSQVRLGIMQWEEKWKATMSERGGDVKIPDFWRVCLRVVAGGLLSDLGLHREASAGTCFTIASTALATRSHVLGYPVIACEAFFGWNTSQKADVRNV